MKFVDCSNPGRRRCRRGKLSFPRPCRIEVKLLQAHLGQSLRCHCDGDMLRNCSKPAKVVKVAVVIKKKLPKLFVYASNVEKFPKAHFFLDSNHVELFALGVSHFLFHRRRQ